MSLTAFYSSHYSHVTFWDESNGCSSCSANVSDRDKTLQKVGCRRLEALDEISVSRRSPSPFFKRVVSQGGLVDVYTSNTYERFLRSKQWTRNELNDWQNTCQDLMIRFWIPEYVIYVADCTENLVLEEVVCRKWDLKFFLASSHKC